MRARRWLDRLRPPVALCRMCGGGCAVSSWRSLRRVPGAVIHDRSGWALGWGGDYVRVRAFPPRLTVPFACRVFGHPSWAAYRMITEARLRSGSPIVFDAVRSEIRCRRCETKVADR